MYNDIKDINLPNFISDNKIIDEVINELFFEDRTKYFNKKNWNIIELSNDYFLESLNFSFIKELMKLSKENYLLFVCPSKECIYFELSIDQDIDELRKFINDNYLYTMFWYFISPSAEWACIAEYDNETLFVGYNSEFEPKLKEIILNNTNFVKYLGKR